MNPGVIHENAFDYFYTLIVDVFIFMVKSIYFFAETLFLTILPHRLRNMKVSWMEVREEQRLCLEENNWKESFVSFKTDGVCKY